jgi:hypothetical protein
MAYLVEITSLFEVCVCGYTHILTTFIYGSFNNTVTSSDYIASNGKMFSEQLIEKDLEKKKMLA